MGQGLLQLKTTPIILRLGPDETVVPLEAVKLHLSRNTRDDSLNLRITSPLCARSILLDQLHYRANMADFVRKTGSWRSATMEVMWRRDVKTLFNQFGFAAGQVDSLIPPEGNVARQCLARESLRPLFVGIVQARGDLPPEMVLCAEKRRGGVSLLARFYVTLERNGRKYFRMSANRNMTALFNPFFDYTDTYEVSVDGLGWVSQCLRSLGFSTSPAKYAFADLVK